MAMPAKFAPTSRTGCLGAFQRFWTQSKLIVPKKSYASDYIAIITLVVAHILLGLLFLTPFHPQFTLNDPRISHPYAIHERVPVLELFLLAGVLPLTALFVWASVARPGWHKLHVTLLGFFLAFLLTSFLTDVIKNAVGRPRPDLLDRCKPDRGAPGEGYVTYKICTQPNPFVLEDGFRSFPSGHSSFSFCGLGYLSFFLLAQLRVLAPRSRKGGADAFRTLLALSPMLAALLIALSRYEDYRHDPYDITAGSLLGLGVAYASWRRYYPAIMSRKCDVPYPPPDPDADDSDDRRLRDEEEMVEAPRGYAVVDDESVNETIPLTSARGPR